MNYHRPGHRGCKRHATFDPDCSACRKVRENDQQAYEAYLRMQQQSNAEIAKTEKYNRWAVWASLIVGSIAFFLGWISSCTL